jgi:hypothetical protein
MQALLFQVFDDMIVHWSAARLQPENSFIQHRVILHHYGEAMIVVHQPGDFFLVFGEFGENVVMVFEHFFVLSPEASRPGFFAVGFRADMALV